MSEEKQFSSSQNREDIKKVFSIYLENNNEVLKNSAQVIMNLKPAVRPDRSPCLGCQFGTWQTVIKPVQQRNKTFENEGFLECYCGKLFQVKYSTNLVSLSNSVFVPACMGNPEFTLESKNNQVEVIEEVEEIEEVQKNDEAGFQDLTNNYFGAR